MKWLRQLGIPILSLVVCGTGFAGTPPRRRQAPPAASADSRPSAAVVALFVNSNLDSARSLAAAALRKNPADLDALFVEMEAAALEADGKGEFQAALRLCEAGSASEDQRPLIAAARILDQAGNTSAFRAAVPRIRKLITTRGATSNFLRAALVAAAADGIPGLSLLDLARESGLITDWRLAGPFGNYPNVAFDRVFAPEYDNLAQANYNGRVVEAFRFYDGNFNLPDYFSTAGVFYAASDLNVAAAGEYGLRAESGGTMEIFVDGASVLKKDDRWRATPEIVWTTLRLSPGAHKLLVKFQSTASPFRVALIAGSDRHGPAANANPASTAGSAAPALAEPESFYVSAALRFWMGDYDAAIAQLNALQKKFPSAALDFLLAKAWQRFGDDSSDQMALWQSALRQGPLAIAAEYELAAREYDTGHNEEAYARVRRVVTARPDFVPGLHLQASIAMELNAHDEVSKTLMAELHLQSSCTTLRDAAKFLAGIAAYDRATDLERQLEGCAPGSLAFAEAQAEAGRHSEAAAAAQRIVLARPLDRAARALLVRELALAGDRTGATRAAQELVAVAPQSPRYRRLAEDVSTGAVVLDSASARARDFFRQKDFYGPFRRNGLEIIHKTAGRHFSGGPALVVLHDRVVRAEPDGAMAVYVHKITRVLNRDGIEKYGEVSVPHGADLLELRTVKQDGTLVEPESNQDKSTISMPALAPGDTIELEYVLYYGSGGMEEHADEFRFTFGSFTAPMLFARFAVLTPAATKMEVIATPGAPRAAETTAENVTARVWERQDIGQSTEEVSAPRRDALPTIRLVASRPGGWQDLRDFYRNELIEAVRIGPRVAQNARDLVGESSEETARNLYHLVTTRLRSTGNEFDGGDLVSAETTLADFSGNRTVALLAMARAAGLDADLLLARDLNRPHPTIAARDAYTRPLVLFRFGHRQIAADAESEGVRFGVLPPTIAHDDALVVPLTDPTAGAPRTAAALIVPVPASLGDEHSNADGDISFDPHGDMTAKVTIRMGAARSAQMRNILSGIEPGGRRRFIEQIAMRIFPGAMDANGEVRNENDSDEPLELRLSCRAPHFLSFTGDTADVDQLAPALGLRKMYGSGPRHLPLYIDMPLVETTSFHVHLPAGVRVAGQPRGARIRSDFGSYSVEFRNAGESEFDVRRSFRIPVQVIAPDRFEAFARFEQQIDEIERQRVTLARDHAATDASAESDSLAARK
jgi:hypothetical protein